MKISTRGVLQMMPCSTENTDLFLFWTNATYNSICSLSFLTSWCRKFLNIENRCWFFTLFVCVCGSVRLQQGGVHWSDPQQQILRRGRPETRRAVRESPEVFPQQNQERGTEPGLILKIRHRCCCTDWTDSCFVSSVFPGDGESRGRGENGRKLQSKSTKVQRETSDRLREQEIQTAETRVSFFFCGFTVHLSADKTVNEITWI